ncbi:SgcJ/EcaC family oxidoreductase [Nocardia speluncae]|uniref:SgcJ/EcaC family oxidoreductase n=1 Tax=Nocardia speluncae TaxID=419477 RepID=A0A846XKP1_9NOCA|nr:SgcJ/EcaC family oxidoreductase [Nocardia speluncae]NKY36871.1 SgcJ/EcaC family oxidoreductase [Nocardia speluncae]
MTEQDLRTVAEAEQQIREVLSRAALAWADNDATAYAAEFTADSDYVAFDGTHVRGREANRALHAGLFEGPLYGTRLEGEIESIRFLTDDVAVAHMTGSVVFAWQSGIPRNRRSRNTWVLHRADGEWKVAAFHNTRVRPLPGDDSPFGRWFATYVRRRTDRARVLTGQS